MMNVRALETPQRLHHRVHLPNAAQKSVAQPLPLARLPEITPGMADRGKRDAALRHLGASLFAEEGGARTIGKGMTAFFPNVEGLEYLRQWGPAAREWTPTPPLAGASCQRLAAQALAREFRIITAPGFPSANVPRAPLRPSRDYCEITLPPDSPRLLRRTTPFHRL